MNCIKENRNIDIDVMKGIGILLVVIGHMVWPFSTNQLIYSFHMPLFVCLSGVVFNPFKLYKNIINILYLYFLWGFIIILLYTLLYTHSIQNFFEQLLHLFLGASANAFVIEHSAAFWYLTCILIIEIIFCLANRTIHPIIVSVLSTIIGLVLFKMKEQITIPYNIDVAFFLYPFFSLGNLYGNKILQFFLKYKFDSRLLILAAILSFMFINIPNGYINIYRGKYGNNVILYYLQGVFGTLMVYFITTILHKKIKSFLMYLGQNTVFILVTHQFFQYTIYSRYIPPNANTLKECVVITFISILMLVAIMCIETVGIILLQKYAPFLLSCKSIRRISIR